MNAGPFWRALSPVLKEEGGLSLDRHDKGNWTGAPTDSVVAPVDATMGKKHAAPGETLAELNEVADAYSKATAAMEKARVASDIKFNRETSLLDPSDVQIAQQLKGLYPDVATALNSVEASAMRSNEALRSIGNTMSSTLTSGLTDMLDGTKSVSQGFTDMGKPSGPRQR